MAHLKTSGHGGDVHAAARELRRPLAQVLDFSASINPLGPSPEVWRAISRARQELLHYPDPDCWALRQVLAKRWKCDPAKIVVGNGSTELIHIFPRALEIRNLVVVQPTFSEYAAAMERSGGHVTTLCSDRAQQYGLPLDRLCQLVERRVTGRRAIDAVVLCNPNSPTGQACRAEDILRVARLAQRRGIWLIVDETFADYCQERSILPLVAPLSRVVVLRSLTKFYGLPGLRVGYAIAAASAVEQVHRLVPPWSVNAMGQVAAIAALQDTAHAKKSLAFMKKERARFARRLSSLPGCTVMPAHANYIFMELPAGWLASEVTARLRRDGILIRDCSNVPGATAGSIRVAVRSKRDNDRLLKSLTRLLCHGAL
ncbi:MAG: threonine-phosphate decarboxylase CobD [Nitrospira sp.]